MEERVLPTREELQELKAQGIIFRSPLATRAVILSAVLITLLFTLKGSTVTGSMPVDVTGLERLARSLLSLVVTTSVVAVLAGVIFSLLLNGFSISAKLIAIKWRPIERTGVLVQLALLALGVALGAELLYALTGDLFLWLRASTELLSDPSLISSSEQARSSFIERLSTRVIVECVFLAILVAVTARVRFLYQNRVPKHDGLGGR
ncbi:MAG: EscU/YscU/HrcU family type III secretion system export apparatus switch protein [Proteobacteria bacterium]|nr:EscU/YscU/HrcU family type III secretion system export apparatus switch protein [Pseudomonadota bacterium]